MPTSRSEEQLANFVHNVAVLRRRHGLSKRVMAKILHIAPRTLNQMEEGHIPMGMKVNTIYYMAAFFHISAPELLRRRF